MSSAISARGCTPTVLGRWEAILRCLRADALDCLQSPLALIADRAYGEGAHLALGCRSQFPTRRADGTVRVQHSLQERMDEASELLGLQAPLPDTLPGAPELRRHLVSAGTLYLVADAYYLPWVPYAGRRHMPHSFLLTMGRSGYTVVDAYHNDTEWGPARPGAWRLSADRVDRVISSGAMAATVQASATQPRLDMAAMMERNAAAARAAAGDIDSYADSLRARLRQPEAIEQFVLDVWLLSRNRLLHTAWLGDHPAAAKTGASAQAWQQLAAKTYLSMRRAERGTPVSPSVVDDMVELLHSDAALIGRLGAPWPANDDDVASAVLEAFRITLQLDDRTLHEATALRALPGFNSFRLVEIIDRVEASLGVQFPADADAHDLGDMAGLCRLFARVAASSSGRQPP